MKKTALGLTLLLVLFAFTQAPAAVHWEGEYFQFRFAVQPNGGIFYNPVTSYFNPDGQSTQVFTNAGATCGTFSSIAVGDLTEFGGAIQMNAMAKGPDGGVNPENGVLVEGYAEITLDMFGDNYGVDVDQLSKAWITRRFRVDQSGPHYVTANFTGEANFAAFGEPSLRYHALYSFKGTATLEEYREGTPPEKLRDVASFSFDNTTGSDGISVDISNQPGLFYQLKVLLDLSTDIQNLYMMTNITGPLPGPFEVGSAESPFQLSAFVTPAVQYNLGVTVSGSGTVTLDPPGGTYTEGTAVTLTADPNAGWQFSGWSGDLTGSGENAVITMDADKSVTATFTEIAPEYTLTMGAGEGGTTTPSIGTHTYAAGTVVDIQAIAEDGYFFQSWTGDVTGSTNPTTITMSSNKSVTANFTDEQLTYTLTMAVTGSGSTTPAVGDHTYNAAEVVDITATPADGWFFNGWTGDVANPGSATTTTTMASDKTVTANFTDEAPEYELIVNTVGEGTVTIDPLLEFYASGTVVNLVADPDAGWYFDGWTGDVASPDSTSTTVTMNSDKIVTATFVENTSPDAPVLEAPEEGAENVSLTPELTTGEYSDPDGHGHGQTQWQMSTNGDDPGFEDALVLDITSECNLESLTVPPYILEILKTYYWRVKFFDDQGGESDWSNISWFTTTDMPLFPDLDGNGINDDQQFLEDDVNGNEIPDDEELETLKSVHTEVDNECYMGVERPEVGTNVASIDYLMAVDPGDIPDDGDKPDEMPIGLVCFQLTVFDPEEPAVVRVYMCRPGPEGSIWYFYGPADCWEDFSDYAEFSEDGTWVDLTLMDGGAGDADGLANGIIIHCSGRGNERHGGGGGSSSDCFIGTAASQLLFGGGLIVLVIIAGSMLAMVIATYVMSRRSKIREMKSS